jgi:poly-gamma-glutamate synthesis protein (capsule biosynthesis protein)
MKDDRKDYPADFVVEFARACIDAGAHAIIGHGPHLVRGIEIYKQRPIFYSLGNFIFQNETVDRQPADFYEKYGLGPEHHVVEAYAKRSGNDSLGFAVNPEVWSSVIAEWTLEDGRLAELTLHPIELGFAEPRHRRGWPRLTQQPDALRDLQRLSREFGTKLTIEAGTARWPG